MIIYSLDILLSQFWSSSLFHVWFIFNEFYCQFTKLYTCQSVQSLSRFWLFATPWTAARQASLSNTIPRAYSNSCPSHWWCHSTFSSSVVPFSSHLQSFPASESFLMSQFFTSRGQSTRVSASISVLTMNIQNWFPLGWAGWISLQSKGLSSLLQHPNSKASVLH